MNDKCLYDISECLNEGVIVIDKSFNIIFINSSLEKIHHISREVAIGKNLFCVYTLISSKRGNLLKILKEHKAILNKKNTYTNYKGEEFTNVSSSYPILEKNKVVAIVEVVLPIDKSEKSTKKFHNKSFNNKNSEINKKTMYDFIDIVGRSKSILEVKKRALKAANSSSSVLVYGEIGVGKELFVHAIHNNSSRKERPFIAQNCAAIPKELFESIMFGVPRGSFTGSENKKGIFEMAHGGTLYLDELNSMPLEFQGKLLTVIQDNNIRKIGDNDITKVDVRIIASLNEEPEKIIKNGILREDLYYRLNVIRLDIPPLRKRIEDIPLFVEYFINKYNKQFNAYIQGIEDDALSNLVNFDWHGNVRQLQYTIESIFNFKTQGFITIEDIYDCSKEFRVNVSLKDKLDRMEKEYINEALIINKFNISKTAKLLGIPRQTLQYKIKKFG